MMSPESMVLAERRARIDRVVATRTYALAVVLDELEDPFNMAAVLRTCEAFGVQRVHVVRHRTQGFRPSDKVTQGCEKWLDLRWHPDFRACADELHAGGYRVLATAATPRARALHEVEFMAPTALVFGNERTGVAPESLAACDGALWIPMMGFSQSLNVSAAAASCLSVAVNWRLRNLGRHGDLTADEAAALTKRFLKLSIRQHRRLELAERLGDAQERAHPSTQRPETP
jgi:tRNA (guanosine-2'-O-)-methyltransferase